MQDEAAEKSSHEAIALLATQQGLSRALASFPDAVRAAAHRGFRPLAPLPPGRWTAEPAVAFAPLRAAPRE